MPEKRRYWDRFINDTFKWLVIRDSMYRWYEDKIIWCADMRKCFSDGYEVLYSYLDKILLPGSYMTRRVEYELNQAYDQYLILIGDD